MELLVPFILASGSPRRNHLLTVTGFRFTVTPPDVDESVIKGESAEEMVTRLALEKGIVVSHQHPEALVLSADTCVVLQGEILGKPASHDEACDMLRRLSGRRHIVHTGIALVHKQSGRSVRRVETTAVDFAPLSEAELRSYVEGGSPMDKAGGYGIQDDSGAFFVQGIEGDFYNVMGLPLRLLYVTLKSDFKDLIAG